jgi:hypothetical protein
MPAILRRRRRESPALDVSLDEIEVSVELPLPLAVVRERPAAAAPAAPPRLSRVVVPPPLPPPAGAHRLTAVAAAARGVPLRPVYLPHDDLVELAEKLEGLARQAEGWTNMEDARRLYIRCAAAARAALREAGR